MEAGVPKLRASCTMTTLKASFSSSPCCPQESSPSMQLCVAVGGRQGEGGLLRGPGVPTQDCLSACPQPPTYQR